MLKTPRTSDVEARHGEDGGRASFQESRVPQAREPSTPEGWPLHSLVPSCAWLDRRSHHELVERSAVEQELPIIQIRNCLLVSIQTELHDRLALDLQASLMDRVRTVNARGVILDVSAVEVIDSYITRILNDIGKSVRFMGAECFIVGIRPAVAMTLIEMGVELDSVHTALNLDLAMERLELLQ
jgi:rsbT antagonist protein RsbS